MDVNPDNQTREEVVLRNQIAEHAIQWADERVLEASKDERAPKYDSAFQHRVNQNKHLNEIRRLVAELHAKEEA